MSSQETQTYSDEEPEYLKPASDNLLPPFIDSRSFLEDKFSINTRSPVRDIRALLPVEIKSRERLSNILKKNINEFSKFEGQRRSVFLDPIEKKEGFIPMYKSPKKFVALQRANYSFKQHDIRDSAIDLRKAKYLRPKQFKDLDMTPKAKRQLSIGKFEHQRHRSLIRESSVNLGIKAKQMF